MLIRTFLFLVFVPRTHVQNLSATFSHTLYILRIEEISDLCRPPEIYRIVNFRRLRWAGNVARVIRYIILTNFDGEISL
jgi:hypothetical protein